MHCRSFLRTPFNSQPVNESQTLQKSVREHIYPTDYLLTVNAKYSRHNAGNLLQPIQMHLS